MTGQKEVLSWMVLAACFLTALSAAFFLNNISPVIPGLMAEFGYSSSQMGMLVSIYSIAGLSLAIPSGLIVTNVGIYKTGIIAALASIAGALLTLGATNYGLFLMGRVIGGAALSLLTVICPVAIIKAFPGRNKATAMGIYNTYMGMSLVMTFAIIPRFYQATNWTTIVFATLSFAVVGLVMWLLIMKRAEIEKTKKQTANVSIGSGMTKVLANKYLWMLSAAFALVLFAFQGVFNFFTLYLNVEKGMDAVTAADYSLAYSIASIIIPTVVGAMCDRMRSYKIPMLIMFVGHCVIYIILPAATAGTGMMTAVVAWAFFAGGTSVGIFSSMPGIVGDSNLYAMGVSVIGLCEKAGVFAGVALYGYMLEVMPWSFLFRVSAVFVVVACILILINKKIKYEKA